ncbi:YeiH family protein [Trinickia dinghuensis]|uniref:Putative sulfate exporter family transporter n=1 Tax=Trinickia dinghuensis TaxID=2291023 RepID=A0A3D8JSM2_9BURK|nr:putative sulfate exporter family transporter [Trinickia dinghuensis]RDU95772.1 putative sulfate exporter family transporter [Trinickia dinghuensis]
MSGSQSGAANAENVNGYESSTGSTQRRLGFWREWTTKEDWWSIWIGWGLVLVAYILYANGGSIRWLAVAPAQWTSVSDAAHFFALHLPNYVALLAVFGVLFSIAVAAQGQRVAHFVPSFLIVFAGSIVIFTLGAWTDASKYNLEPPLVALAAGLILSNVFKLPEWFHAGLRVELYIKVGIVLLGATLPFTLLVWAGPVAVGQATIVSLSTFFVIFLVGSALGLDKRFAAVLGTGGAVCGVSASIAIAGAVRAKREHASVAITLVIVWAIVMIFALPFISRAFGLPTGIAGAWIGTSEFADAAGIAAAQAYGDLAKHGAGAIAGAPEASLQAFTLMKVVGRDIWIGIWAFVLAIVATTRWDREGELQVRSRAGEIWARFPKFVIGFVIASAFVTWVASGHTLGAYRKIVAPEFTAPITVLRTWAFIFCFFSIGLTTRLRSLSATGVRPFIAFTAGVAVNVIVGYVLSVHVFGHYWASLG